MTPRRYQKRERELVQNFATPEERKAALYAQLARYKGNGWSLIGTPSETKARIYKGKEVRDISVGIDGEISDRVATDYPHGGESGGHVARNTVIIVVSVVVLIAVIAAVSGQNKSGGGSASTGAGSSGSHAQVTAHIPATQRVGDPVFMTIEIANTGSDIQDLRIGFRDLDSWVFNTTTSTGRTVTEVDAGGSDRKFSYSSLGAGQRLSVTAILVPKKAGNPHIAFGLFNGSDTFSFDDEYYGPIAINP